LRESGDLAGAKARYETALAIRERLVRDFPAAAEVQRDLSISYERLGDVFEATGALPRAVELYERSLRIADALARANPSHAGLANDAAITRQRLAALKVKAGA